MMNDLKLRSFLFLISFTVPLLSAQPHIDQVTNNYNFLSAENPNYGIAQGSIFSIFGSNLSDSSSGLQNVPLPTVLNGVSAQVTVNGTTTNVIWYYVTPDQLGGILPSRTPTGTGTITVTNKGQTSAPAPIKVVQSAFGTLTLDGSGWGAAAVHDKNYKLLSPSNSSKPGDIIVLYGSGAGPVSDDEKLQQIQVNLTTPISVEIGGMPANVLYHGRTIYPGLDQINVVIPDGIQFGCHVSVVVRSGTYASNFTTIPVASDRGDCPVPADPCAVNQIRPERTRGIPVWSPDRSRYFVNTKDSQGISQVYVGQKDGAAPVCISCTDKPNGPKAKKHKMQARWHPSGRWIVLAVEQDNYSPPPLSTPDIIEGLLESGIWVDMWATTPDGSSWFKLQDFGPSNKADGFTGVAFTPDGRKGVWAQIVDGNVFAYSFGKWQLIIADFQNGNGVPSFTNLRDITPPDTDWAEPGNFSPNGKDLVLTADQGFPNHAQAQGQDQYILDINTGRMTNLTNSPAIWDEHGVFSPDGEKILFMSSYPYRSDPLASTTFFLKTEFMIMDKDGSNLRQISHFNQPGFAESGYKVGAAAVGGWSIDGTTITALQLFFPNYQAWDIRLEGNCGNRSP